VQHRYHTTEGLRCQAKSRQTSQRCLPPAGADAGRFPLPQSRQSRRGRLPSPPRSHSLWPACRPVPRPSPSFLLLPRTRRLAHGARTLRRRLVGLGSLSLPGRGREGCICIGGGLPSACGLQHVAPLRITGLGPRVRWAALDCIRVTRFREEQVYLPSLNNHIGFAKKKWHIGLIYLPHLGIRFSRLLQLLKPSDLSPRAVWRVVLADAAQS